MHTQWRFWVLLVLFLSHSAQADLYYEENTTMKEGNKVNRFLKKAWAQKTKIRIEMPAPQGGQKTFIIANEDGMFSCVEKMKMCSKMPYRNGATQLFANLSSEVKTVSLTMNRTGVRRTIQGYACEEYKVERVMDTVGDAFSKPSRSRNTEVNCYSPKFRDAFPKEMVAEYKKSVSQSDESPQIKKLLLDELALGIAIKHQATTTGAGIPVLTVQGEASMVKLGPVPESFFRVPSGYRVHDMGRFVADQQKRQLSMQKQMGDAIRPQLTPEQLQQLKKLRESGMSEEQQRQLDMFLKD